MLTQVYILAQVPKKNSEKKVSFLARFIAEKAITAPLLVCI